jgi:hypothetical protein
MVGIILVSTPIVVLAHIYATLSSAYLSGIEHAKSIAVDVRHEQPSATPDIAKAHKSPANDLNQSYDFKDNSVPPGWNIGFLPGTPGRNASVKNHRFEVDQIDTYGELSENVQLPATTTSLHISFITNVADVPSGMGSQIHLYDNNGDVTAVYFGKTGNGIELMNVGAEYDIVGGTSDIILKHSFDPAYGSYQFDAVFRDGQVTLSITPIESITSLYQGTTVVSGLKLNQISRVGFVGITTTGSPSWITNIVIKSSL